MNKTQRINYLVEKTNEQRAEILRLTSEKRDGIKARAKALYADLAAAAAEKKAATEAATLKAIRDGFVPIAVLRDLVGAEYTTEHCQSFTKTNLTVMLNAAKPVDKAILAALLEKPVAPRGYASGGLTGQPSGPWKVGDKVTILNPSPDLGSGWFVAARA